MGLFSKLMGVSLAPFEEVAPAYEEQNVKEAQMSEEEKVGERCHQVPNLCNDSNYLFGRTECVDHPGIPLRTAGGTKLGYAVNKGKAKHVKIVWKGLAKETLIIQKNGQDVEYITLDETDVSPNCVPIKEHFCDCDVLNVIEVPHGVIKNGEEPEVGDFHPACAISVVVEYEQKCYRRFKPEQDGVAEAVDTTDTTAIVDPNLWYPKVLDYERMNTLPSFISFVAGVGFELRHGKYIIDYGSAVKFDKSVALRYDIKLQYSDDGITWVDYPYSEAGDAVLYGQGISTVEASRTVTLEVPYQTTKQIRIVEMISDDSYVVSTGGAGYMVVERCDKGLKF